jgi:hypothetical protein
MNNKKFIDIEKIEKHFRIEEDGAIWSLRKHKYLKPTFNSAGYLYVMLTVVGDNGLNDPELTRQYGVHRLVATKFLGQCPDDKETSHKDGHKMNNHYSNLEYLTHSQNVLKSYSDHGRSPAVYPRHAMSDATKELMSNAKKKAVRCMVESETIIFPSIEETTSYLNSYRKAVSRAISNNKPLKGAILAFEVYQ